MVGRRLTPEVDEDGRKRLPLGDWQPGDYCGPITGYTGPATSVFFLLPNARDLDAPASARAIHHVSSPPHTFRECVDGSLEIRASISDQPGDTGWHGWLDEGHVWRQA